jgi:hypothetical protein
VDTETLKAHTSKPNKHKLLDWRSEGKTLVQLTGLAMSKASLRNEGAICVTNDLDITPSSQSSLQVSVQL